jgi:hypothetical protein
VQSIPKDTAGQLRFALAATIEVVALEMRKLLDLSRTERAMVASPKEIAAVELRAVQMMKLLQSGNLFGENRPIETEGELIESLTEDEQRVLLALLEKRGV